MKVKVSHFPTSNESQEFDLLPATQRGKEWIIGRSSDSDFFLDSSDVSRLHAKFFFQGGNYYFSDLGSRNGSTVNGKLAEKNQAYILRGKDIIRIGDFILVIEEILSLSEQAETVVRIINPSQFSNWRSTQNAENVSVENETPEVVETPVGEELSQTPQFAETPVGEELSQTPEVVETPVGEELSQTPEVVETPELGKADSLKLDEVSSEPTFIQVESAANLAEAIAPDESTIEQDEAAKVASIISNQATETATPAKEEVTADVDSAIPEIDIPDFTYVQPRNIINQPPDETTLEESTSQSAEADSDETELSEDKVTETINDLTPETEELDYTIVQAHDISHPFTEEKTTPETTDEPAEVVNIVASEENEDLALNNIEFLPTTESETPVSTQLSEEVEEATVPEATIFSEFDSANQSSEEVSETEPASVSEYPESLAQKRIVLVAHETKKSELVDFVAEHQKFFSVCHTLAWSSVSEVLSEQAGITISQQIPAGTSGGYQSIASLIASGDISAVIFLRDFLQPQPGQANEDAMLRLCNINEVLVATNVVTARAIVHYISQIESRS
ncbi:MAG: methylglyoxal synthase [Nostoc sp.]|uniref:methylglyoxal synthase n=1 Tax=Nostoc sp. TaxID=1180 RepID=UPI002FF811EE